MWYQDLNMFQCWVHLHRLQRVTSHPTCYSNDSTVKPEHLISIDLWSKDVRLCPPVCKYTSNQSNTTEVIRLHLQQVNIYTQLFPRDRALGHGTKRWHLRLLGIEHPGESYSFPPSWYRQSPLNYHASDLFWNKCTNFIWQSFYPSYKNLFKTLRVFNETKYCDLPRPDAKHFYCMKLHWLMFGK